METEIRQGKLQRARIWLQAYYVECMRVLKVTQKPTAEEFKTIVKVSALGMLIIGLLGFLIFMLAKLVI
jgi:protein transport protein SEC61 subunit gamma and related proteins